jgi:hypothetical protein
VNFRRSCDDSASVSSFLLIDFILIYLELLFFLTIWCLIRLNFEYLFLLCC